MGIKASARADQILLEVRHLGSASVEHLCRITGASLATMRRDLQELEGRGCLRRTRGGAAAIEPLFYEPFRHDSSFQEQMNRNAEQKRRIGIAASELIEDGETISITPGTTTTEVIRNLRNRGGVTVVTSTVSVAMELSSQKNVDVFVTGGFLRGHWFSMVGPSAVAAAGRVFPDKMFIGVNGIDAERGLTSLDADEAELIAVMMRQAKRRIVVADSSKLGAVARHFISPADEVEMLITDSGASDGDVGPFLHAGIEVRRV